MSDVRSQQEVTESLMDGTASEVNLEVPCVDYDLSGEIRNSSGELAVPRRAGNFTNEIEEFIPGMQQYFKNIRGEELSADEEKRYRQLFSVWNTFLQLVQGKRDTSAIISSDINEDINNVMSWLEEEQGAQWTEDNKKKIKLWLPRWNMFLQARTGKTLVTWRNVYLTILGFLFYIVDLGSDIGTSIYYAGNGQWWRAIVTLAVVYDTIFIYTVIKWINKEIHCTGTADWLRYVGSSLVNWPDLKQYGALCLLECKLYKSHASSARLVPEWHERRVNVALLKFTEGVWEACPQAILQFCLLVPDLYGVWTWTDYLRIAGASVSLCTAGAALVNMEKCDRINNYSDVLLTELIVLHVWAVPVTVSRLLSVTLLLTVHPYWALAGVALHLILYGIYWCRTSGVPRTLDVVILMCLSTLQFCMSPFFIADSITYRRVYHTIHFLVNTAMTVVWALGTPLLSAQPAVYTAIICFNAVMFAVGLMGWQIHETRSLTSVCTTNRTICTP